MIWFIQITLCAVNEGGNLFLAIMQLFDYSIFNVQMPDIFFYLLATQNIGLKNLT